MGIYDTPQSAIVTKFDKKLAISNSKKYLRGSIKDVELTPLEQGTYETVNLYFKYKLEKKIG